MLILGSMQNALAADARSINTVRVRTDVKVPGALEVHRVITPRTLPLEGDFTINVSYVEKVDIDTHEALSELIKKLKYSEKKGDFAITNIGVVVHSLIPGKEIVSYDKNGNEIPFSCVN